MLFILLAVLGLLSLTSSQISHQYHLINIRKNWTEAQRYCRDMYTDLATVNNADEMNSLFRSVTNVSHGVYIGLYRSKEYRWHWSLPDTFYDEDTFQNWKNKQSAQNNEGCAAMDNSGKWFSDSCDSSKAFVCFNATTNKKQIHSTDDNLLREAQKFCRTLLTDLANVRNSSEKRVKNITCHNITSLENDVWIVVFKDSWSWSDQSNSSFRFWNSSKLSNIRRNQDCVSVMVNKPGKWNDVHCNSTLPFICHGDLKSQSTTESATPGPATTEHRPAQNTTQGGKKSSQTTQILTTGPEQDDLILVRENLTWTEAASYCRKHHVDLISIQSEELQNSAARKAMQASTSHVWMGLRYTCTFNFWFWIKNREAGCYQNWASGQGPHGFEECGLSGAMESTGGHRWVGRPESDRLNFICHTCAGCQLCNKAPYNGIL